MEKVVPVHARRHLARILRTDYTRSGTLKPCVHRNAACPVLDFSCGKKLPVDFVQQNASEPGTNTNGRKSPVAVRPSQALFSQCFQWLILSFYVWVRGRLMSCHEFGACLQGLSRRQIDGCDCIMLFFQQHIPMLLMPWSGASKVTWSAPITYQLSAFPQLYLKIYCV